MLKISSMWKSVVKPNTAMLCYAMSCGIRSSSIPMIIRREASRSSCGGRSNEMSEKKLISSWKCRENLDGSLTMTQIIRLTLVRNV